MSFEFTLILDIFKNDSDTPSTPDTVLLYSTDGGSRSSTEVIVICINVLLMYILKSKIDAPESSTEQEGESYFEVTNICSSRGFFKNILKSFTSIRIINISIQNSS